MGWLLCRYCWPHCCRQGKSSSNGSHVEEQSERRVRINQLQEKKCTLTGYVLWLFAGLFGTHHFYLGRVVHGLLAAWSLNFLAIGWIADAFLLPGYVQRHNSKHTDDVASYDSSRRALLFRLPPVALGGVTCLVGLFFYAPTLMHHAGVFDLERIASQTSANPYDVLGITRSASSYELKTAYRKASLHWHPDRNLGCGEVCEKKMADITKAFKYIKEGREPSAGRTWRSLVEDACSNWRHVLDALQSAAESDHSSHAEINKVHHSRRPQQQAAPKTHRSES